MQRDQICLFGFQICDLLHTAGSAFIIACGLGLL
jgi:hypothetical protein